MCKLSDIRYTEDTAEDGNWVVTRFYSVMFNGWRGFFEEECRSMMSTWAHPIRYDGRQAYWCHGCVRDFDTFNEAQLHVDEPPDENPDVLGWFGIR